MRGEVRECGVRNKLKEKGGDINEVKKVNDNSRQNVYLCLGKHRCDNHFQSSMDQQKTTF